MPLEKPATITLQSGHGFLTDLVGAWLFTEGTNFTFADSSGLGNHLSRTLGSGGTWTRTGTNAVYFNIAAATVLGRGGADTDFEHGAADPWTVIYWISRRGDSAGTYQRLQFRSVNNTVDQALKITTWQPAWFSGAAWQDIGGASAVSGADEMYAFAYDGTNLRVYKGSDQIASGVTLLDARAAAPVITNTLQLFGNNAGEDFFGNVYATFYHRRALSLAQLATHFSAPFEAFQDAAAPGGGAGSTFYYRGSAGDADFYRGSRGAPGGSAHLLDWLGGR